MSPRKRTLKPGITVHCIVRNEERFIWYALRSVLPYVERILIYDTGSTDKTVEIIKSITDPKIELYEKGPVDKTEFATLRREHIALTETAWFLVLDGDEIWPPASIEAVRQACLKAAPAIDTIAVKFWNFCHDVFHYQPDEEGGYEIGGQRGFITVRATRTDLAGLTVGGDYGVEGYYDGAGRPVQDRGNKHLLILDCHYFHASNLVRSSSLSKDWEIGYRRRKLFTSSTAKRKAENDLVVRDLFSQPVPITGYSPLSAPSWHEGLFQRVGMRIAKIAQAVKRRI
jgi:glycosyltransferase involved in cell wall biosynthesis